MENEPIENDTPRQRHLDERVVRAVRRELLAWYRKHRRALPWRSLETVHPDPYHVLVSEAMLQQTQVATVVPYFQRFIAAFPTVAALAAADEQAVLRMWQGLGYYRRARNLHEAAKKIVDELSGKVPDTIEGLLALPGVGRYTAGAVASIAFGKAAPILDGNVARVIARLLAIEQSIDDREVIAELWQVAGVLVRGDGKEGDAGDFNQGLMELGAMVCTPTSPRCDICPVADWCEAKSRKLMNDLPVRAPRRKPLEVSHHVVALQRITTTDGATKRLLWEQRPGVGLWSNMWQMPTLELEAEDKIHREADVRKWMIGEYGVRVGRLRKIGTFNHQTTHRTISFTVWHGTVEGTGAGVGSATHGIQRTTRAPLKVARLWRAFGEVDDLPLANPQKMAIKLLAAEGK